MYAAPLSFGVEDSGFYPFKGVLDEIWIEPSFDGYTPLDLRIYYLTTLNPNITYEEILYEAIAYKPRYRVDGMFVNFGPDKFDWFYIPMRFDTSDWGNIDWGSYPVQRIYKLEGLDIQENALIWRRIEMPHKNFLFYEPPYTLVVRPTEELYYYGYYDPIYNVFLNKEYLDVNGYFFHYGDDPYDWIYFTLNRGYLPIPFEDGIGMPVKNMYKLDGMNPETGDFIWTKIKIPEGKVILFKYPFDKYTFEIVFED
ncbi:MAG: hypothetical protein C6H99_04280 [Epsilonproteobacteria bacterium]|nr:hypothetical protein [Campylobacterota bacterium]